MLPIQEIPLSKLLPSKANVRRTNAKSGIGELAASIEAHGLLQNLTVRPVPKAKGRGYEVVAGGRRLAALKALAKKKAIPASAPIPCHVLKEGVAEEISLAENLLQCPMHPADQYEAFAKLHHEHGMSAEDIAARFGVTAAVVKQRLKLGAVSAVLMKAYREEELDLEALTAFAITDDHEAQERVWAELPDWNRRRHAILQALTEGQVSCDDRRARFVGAKAYKAAGGVIARDLFDEEERGGYFADAALLNRLVREKLQGEAEKVIAEGWKWVSVDPEFDYQRSGGMRRVHPKPVPLSDEQQARLEALEAEYNALCDSDEGDPKEAIQRGERLEAEIEALTGQAQFEAEAVAIAGAFVALGHDGTVRIERGFIRPEDAKRGPASAAGEAESGEEGERPRDDSKPLSEKLVAELTAHRTAALRNDLAQKPDTALIAVVHALAAAVFFSHEDDASCLELRLNRRSLDMDAPGIEESRAGREISARHSAWEARMPEEPEALWAFVSDLASEERLELLAHCAALSVNAVRVPKQHSREAAEAHASVLATRVGLDMAAYWQPTVGSYLGRVSKYRILDALAEGVSKECAENLEKLKKQAMAEAAEQRLAGKRWLPALLR